MKIKIKKNIFNFASAAIILVLVLCAFVSCGENSGNGAENQNGDPQSPGQNDENSPQGESQDAAGERIYPNIPDSLDFSGYEFSILTFGVNGSDQWENIDLTSEEETGDTVGDAVYRRNKNIEERYNIALNEIHVYNEVFGNSLKKEIGAGTHEYDLISPRLIDSANFMQSGYFMDLFKAPNIDLAKPWYSQQGIQEMSIGHKVFIVLSDTLLSGNDATSITIFNKQLIKDSGLEDPYALVKNGTWTVGKLYEMAKATAKDLDGDGEMTPEADRFGYITWNDAMVSYLHSGGQRLIAKDEDDLPVLAFNTEKTYAVMEKAMDLIYDENVTGNVQKPEFSGVSFEDIFISDRAAFGWCRLYMIPKLRAMDTDFGILPIPKIYESTEGYPSTVNVHHACALAIPITTDEMDRTTIVMEALAAESKYTLQPAYYEISLKTKYSRDDESSEMLDLILENRVMDIGDVYNFASFGDGFYQLALKNDRNLASFYEKNESKVNKEIEKMIQKFEALD
ncbi:MAG: hypothetical protein FWG34_09780 [Oscillospiraceae bacterium]|nr:hypothetical protein [Oscillospiraceae bacterium]